MNSIKTAIGLMSGTSMDGIDVALIKSDGHKIFHKGEFGYYKYDNDIRGKLKKLVNSGQGTLEEIKEIEIELTKKHIEAVLDFLKTHNLNKNEIDVIGFHGHTIYHNSSKQITWQLGNAALLAKKTGINVIADFRTNDVICGGNGAPLVPIYHHVLFKEHPKPIIVLNIGGVSNVTYISDEDENNLIAYDLCFGNAPLDDLVHHKINLDYDQDGNLAMRGEVNLELCNEFLNQDYFKKLPPKSLDRNEFNGHLEKIKSLKLEDALASMCYIIAQSLKLSFNYLPKEPEEIIICGGGRKNQAIINYIRKLTSIKVSVIDVLAHDGNAIEAEAFGFLAIRSLLDLPISFRKTTGVLPEKHAVQSWKEEGFSSCGGVFYRA